MSEVVNLINWIITLQRIAARGVVAALHTDLLFYSARANNALTLCVHRMYRGNSLFKAEAVCMLDFYLFHGGENRLIEGS
jgi:hypothetical protein